MKFVMPQCIGPVVDSFHHQRCDLRHAQVERSSPCLIQQPSLYDGKRWGLPYDGDTHVLFYNTEIFGQLGLTAPETWEQVLANAQAVTEAGLTNAQGNPVYGIGIMGVKAPILLGSSYINRFAGYGGTFFKEDGSPNFITRRRALRRPAG